MDYLHSRQDRDRTTHDDAESVTDDRKTSIWYDPLSSSPTPSAPTSLDWYEVVGTATAGQFGLLNGVSGAQPLPAISTSALPLAGQTRWLETVADRAAITPSTAGAPSIAAAGLIHDARNLVTTLDLYCDLLDAPGVLAASYRHYACELRLIARGSRRILASLSSLEERAGVTSPGAAQTRPNQEGSQGGQPAQACDREPSSLRASAGPTPIDVAIPGPATSGHASPTFSEPESNAPRRSFNDSASVANPAHSSALRRTPRRSPLPLPRRTNFEHPRREGRWHPLPGVSPIRNLAEELLANHSLLSALAGPGITVGLSLYDGNEPIPLSPDDLTRILVNLVKNAAEAMPDGGHIQIALERFSDHLRLTVADTGTGIPEASLETIFSAGYTTNIPLRHGPPQGGFEPLLSPWPSPRRGLGLAIVRSLVAGCGGTVTSYNRRDFRESQQFSSPEASEEASTGAVFSLCFPLTANSE